MRNTETQLFVNIHTYMHAFVRQEIALTTIVQRKKIRTKTKHEKTSKSFGENRAIIVRPLERVSNTFYIALILKFC